MIVTFDISINLYDLLDVLDLELVDVEDDGVEYDEDGTAWYYDEDLDATFYFDEDLDDWAEVDEDGVAWYLDDDSGALYFFDDECDGWVEYDESEDDSAA
jgi:hypothetical protein